MRQAKLLNHKWHWHFWIILTLILVTLIIPDLPTWEHSRTSFSFWPLRTSQKPRTSRTSRSYRTSRSSLTTRIPSLSKLVQTSCNESAIEKSFDLVSCNIFKSHNYQNTNSLNFTMSSEDYILMLIFSTFSPELNL